MIILPNWNQLNLKQFNGIQQPKAVATLRNPKKLIKGTIEVYGKDNYASRYGKIEPIDPARMHSVKHGEIVKLQNNAKLHLFHAPGHANHHIIAFESSNRAVFTGDAFGVSYGQTAELRKFIAPTASPVVRHFFPISILFFLESKTFLPEIENCHQFLINFLYN